ncbi:MAG: single-stranded DNA-binding protein [Cyanobacteria bacterium RYN_339]|nr:single-stranded DNA-binding protein [Cyanobacteria bacterium RYN_339]
MYPGKPGYTAPMPDHPLLGAARELSQALAPLRFGPPVTHVYDPLTYAGAMHAAFIARYGQGRKRTVFLGMNPGPWGMAQTGVPFGEVAAVRDWLQLDAPIGKPLGEHPKRPVDGLACTRAEVSGKRLWGAMAARFGTPEAFFQDHYVINYCPLLFLEASGKNRTPDQLPAAERRAIAAACDRHLRAAIAILQPEWVIGVGNFAEERARTALADVGVKFGRIPHPSPASPAANKGWEPAATLAMNALGLWLP